MAPPVRPLRDRVFAKLEVQPDGCVLWTGNLTTTGYGQVRRPRRGTGLAAVHRLMYEWFTGPIPDGMELDHLCRVKHCAAPAHLEAVTHAENLRRAPAYPRHNAVKTECPRGHAYDEANTYRSNGRRFCRQCRSGNKRSTGKSRADGAGSWLRLLDPKRSTS